MNFDKIKKGDTISVDINGVEVECTYVGRFDFLYLFNTQFKTLPKVARVQNHSIAIVNQDLLNKYGMTKEEARAILYHEVGHMISPNQARLDGIDAECDADDYAISKEGKKTVLSALEKTKRIVEGEASSEEKKKKALAEIEKRYNTAKVKKEKSHEQNEEEEHEIF